MRMYDFPCMYVHVFAYGGNGKSRTIYKNRGATSADY